MGLLGLESRFYFSRRGDSAKEGDKYWGDLVFYPFTYWDYANFQSH